MGTTISNLSTASIREMDARELSLLIDEAAPPFVDRKRLRFHDREVLERLAFLARRNVRNLHSRSHNQRHSTECI